LKVEEIQATPSHPETAFTDQDQALVMMMASAITAVIENTRLADQRLLDMTKNLQQLSNAMTGGTGQTTLVQRVVDAITAIMRAMAASLYLLEPDRHTLRIRAASGYQTGLMVKGKTYDLFGKGVTSSIARNNEVVIANSLSELHAQRDWAGANNPGQGGREPNAFLGIPLTVQVKDEKPQVIGVLKVEDIQPGPGHPDKYFTDQDVVLVKMMGAIIAATLHNTRQSDARLADVLIEATHGSLPLRSDLAALATWSALLRLNDRAIYEAFAAAFFQAIQPVDWDLLAEQTRLLLAMNLNDDFYQTMSTMAPEGICQRWFNTLARYSGLPSARRTHVLQALMIDREWQEFMRADPGAQDERSLELLFPSFMKGVRFEIDGIKHYRILRVFELNGALPPTMSSRLEAIPQKLPLLFFNGPDWDGDTAQQDLKEYLPVAQAQYGKNSKILLLSLAMPEGAARQAENDLRPVFAARFIDVLPMGLSEIQEYIVSRDPKQELLARLLRTVNLELISPYRGEGSTRSNMFFGREKILQEITTSIAHASFCLVGGRKVGKTSILHRLHNLTLGPAGYHSAYFDLLKYETIAELLAQPVTDWQPNPPENAPYTLGELLDNARKGQNIVLLFDEFDKIIDEDEKNHWAFLYRLRSLNFEEKIRFVLGGEMRLNHLSKEGGDALYNFTTRLLIKPLDSNEVHQLVTQPMQDMQIGLNDPEKITQRIYEFSGGHPAVVQYICRRLIILLNENRDRPRTIHMDDVETVFKQTDFQRDEFLKLYWERASTVEKIISMVMVEHGEASFSLDDVQERLTNETRLSIADNIVAEALTALNEIRSIFKFDGGRYSYAVSAFREILTNNDLRLLLLRSAIAEFHNGK
jgi:GAF domain-containing protein